MRYRHRFWTFLSLLAFFAGSHPAFSSPVAFHAQEEPEPIPDIRVNQLGFYPSAPKLAVIILRASMAQAGKAPAVFYVIAAGGSLTGRDTVFRGQPGPVKGSSNSSLQTCIADFSGLRKEGVYIVAAPGMEHSYPFRIGKEVLRTASIASLKGYYYQRSAMPLDPAYAGQWSRPAGHPDTAVLIHPSAASEARPAGTVISATGGWYDAGDYNKYIVNSGVTMGTLFSAYEDFPAYFDKLNTQIPESGNGLPDILNEALYNLRWMLRMQDPSDGGVYNKCTNAAFDGMVMPGVTKLPRYVVQKGTAATLDFAAVTAQAGRILRKFDRLLPGLSDSCLSAAAHAWQWALKNPALAYNQEAMNKLYEPKVSTGGYGDGNFKDEWFWAAAELLVNTKEEQYKKIVLERMNDPMSLPSWANVSMLGNYTLLRHGRSLPSEVRSALPALKDRLLSMADEYVPKAGASSFRTVMGQSIRDFVWGSNSVAANQGILLINAWLQTNDKKYIDLALGNLDYLLGRNATGYCFLTGIGSYSPMHPHHRPSVADGIVAPVPGLLAGGPNPGRQDHCKYEFTEPETAYTDQAAAYAANEIAINWNAPLVYLAAALEALQYKAGYSL